MSGVKRRRKGTVLQRGNRVGKGPQAGGNAWFQGNGRLVWRDEE